MFQAMRVLSVCMLLGLAGAVLAADAATEQTKTGPIKSIDAKAKTFILDLKARPLTFTVDDKTTFTLDGKASTFEAAVKVDLKATVTYLRKGDDRPAVKVEVTTEKEKK